MSPTLTPNPTPSRWNTDILPTLPKAEWLGDRPVNKSCVSIDVGTDDSWCQTMCAAPTALTLTLCLTLTPAMALTLIPTLG